MTAAVGGLMLALAVRSLSSDPVGPAIRERDSLVREITAALEASCGPGPVQSLGTAGGGIHALLRLERRQPTRFLYDFPFYAEPDRVVVQSLRDELMQGLSASPPRCVLLLENSWPGWGYERVESFPRLEKLLADRYLLVEQGSAFRIYALP